MNIIIFTVWKVNPLSKQEKHAKKWESRVYTHEEERDNHSFASLSFDVGYEW